MTTYNTNNQIKFKTSLLRSSLCDYSDVYILVRRTITITGAGNDASRRLDERNKGVVLKNCAPFTDCIWEINNTQIDSAKYIDVVMPMYNLIEYSDNYSKTSGRVWQYYRDDPHDNITQSESFKYKIKITGKTPTADNTEDVEIAMSLKYSSNFWRTLETTVINCEINLILSWPEDCVISFANGATKFKITDAKLYVPVVTLSTQDNARLLKQLKSGFKRTINWNKYQTKVSTQRQNQYLDFLIDPMFQGINRLFVLSFENEGDRKVHTGYYLPRAEIKNSNVMIDGKSCFDQLVKSYMRTHNNIYKIATGQGDDYTTGCLLDYNYFNNYYKMIAVDLSKQQALDADSKVMQQINFTGNLERDNGAIMFFIIEEARETVLDFCKELLKYCECVPPFYFVLI